MVKKDIAKFIVERGAIPQADTVLKAEKIVDEVLRAITTILTTNKDESLEIRGFATFKHVTRTERPVHDFKNNKKIFMPSQQSVKVKWCRAFIEKLNS